MIVRISGEGQYELDDAEGVQLEKLDAALTGALEAGDEQSFHQHLNDVLTFIRKQGDPVPAGRVVPSQVIIPPDDVTMAEAQRFFSDDGRHMQPVSV